MSDCTQAALHLITGPMCSGKSSELLRRLFVAKAAGRKCIYINHAHDTRRSPGEAFSTHNPLYKEKLAATSGVVMITTSKLLDNRIATEVANADVVAIDEGQFFPDLEKAVRQFVEDDGQHVIVAGLNGDFKQNNFGQMHKLFSRMDSIVHLKPFCGVCAKLGIMKDGVFTLRHGDQKQQVVVGGVAEYTPVCRRCYAENNV